MERREKWIKAIKREDITENKLKNQKVCAKHFLRGRPAKLTDKNHPDWSPTQNMGHQSIACVSNKRALERKIRLENRKKIKSDHVASTSMQEEIQILESEDQHATETGTSIQTTITMDELDKLMSNLGLLQEIKFNLTNKNKKISLDKDSFTNNDEKTFYYTGMSYKLMTIVFKQIEKFLPHHFNNKLEPFQCFLLTLMKFRLNLQNTDLSYRFGVSIQTIASCFENTVDILYKRFKSLIIWPEREVREKNIPTCFKESFQDKTTVIIDCFEIFIQKPCNFLTQQQCWSNYKHHNTIKFLIGITPQGTVSYISNAWGGRISDKQITQYSTFLNNINPHDIVLADRGFLISDMVGILRANVVIPAFTKGKNQLHPVRIEETRQIAHCRIHVERVIGLLKNKYKLFEGPIPISMISNISNGISILDKIVHVCCAFINLSPPIIPK